MLWQETQIQEKKQEQSSSFQGGDKQIMMKGLCHICYCSNIEVFFLKKDRMAVCADCAADEHYSNKGDRK